MGVRRLKLSGVLALLGRSLDNSRSDSHGSVLGPPGRAEEVHIDVVTTAASLVAFPVAAGILGGAVAALRTPPISVVSGVQHFAAGVVMAAVAGEVLPDLRARGSIWLTIVGFAAGVALLLVMRRFEDEHHHKDTDENGDADPQVRAPGGLPVGFLVVVAVDLFIDGLLVGAGAAVSTDTAVVITIALTVEVLFLGLTVVMRLTSSGVPGIRAAATTAGVSLTVALGAVLGALALSGASDAILGLVLAFAAAALLWLVVEELLVEAHEAPERPWMAAMFFVGFLAVYCLEMVG